MTRDEHLAWAKTRALEYVDENDLPGAIASMISDLNKHADWQGSAFLDALALVGMIEIQNGREAVVQWIEGFH